MAVPFRSIHCPLYKLLFFYQDFPRYLGDKQSWFIKIVLGGLLLTALVLLIWGPLLVMSVITTQSQANEPTEVSIRLSLAGYEVSVYL